MDKAIEKLLEKQKYINNPQLKRSMNKKIDILKGNKTVKK